MAKPIAILLEENEFAADVIRRTLAFGGYDYVDAQSEEQVLELCRNYSDRPRILITELILPNCSGADVALAVSAYYPDLPILFVTSIPFDAWPESDRQKFTTLPAHNASQIDKPFRAPAFLAHLTALVQPRQNRASI